MKDIPTIRGRQYIARLVAEGEHEQQDFKFLISDARKIARSVSAFANNRGGRLLIGVKDNGRVAGVRNEEDIYMVEQAAERYCDPPQQVEFTAFTVDAGVVVIRASIAAAQTRPVRVREADGTLHAYYRVADQNISAPELMVQSWLRRQDNASSAFDPASAEVLGLIEARPGGLTPREIAVALHMSVPRVEETVVELAASGLVTFSLTPGSFRLIRM